MKAVLCAIAIMGCGAPQSRMTLQDSDIVGSEGLADEECVRTNRGDAGAMQSCRDQVKRSYDAYWHEHFHGDGGTK